MKVLVFGEILWDIIEGVPHLGGAPLNFAAHVAQCGYDSAIVSCLGKDNLGDDALRMVQYLNVDVRLVQRSDIRTGFVPVTLCNGQPDYEIIENVAYDYIDGEKLDHTLIGDYDTFYFGSLIQRSEVSASALQQILDRHRFKQVFYDVNLRKNSFNKDIVVHSLGHCNLLKVNDEEVGVLSKLLFDRDLDFDAFCEKVIGLWKQIEAVVITAGGDGSLVYWNGQLEKVPTSPIEVIDTVGAGDSFSAAFLCIYNKTGDPVYAAQIANKVGAFVASSNGPIPRYSPEIISCLV
ncbi:carbohydrate kinase [Marinoscillum sp. MHG1-6]|uniref:carbohydrate kinase family protein n=1 Tax=Marinoscillum sp. MHG1-6 TaxID=2959627 RepID=UPI002157D028|nr:carbohydrate kinase [Marinoscillum sp. MHG1-6]